MRKPIPEISLLFKLVIAAIFLGAGVTASAANKPEKLEWLKNAGFGLFIHWSVDSQIGTVISHSVVGASDDYLQYFFEDLPKTFDPKDFDAVEWAQLARLCGFKYVVFTAKHHSGFCMWPSDTTEFDISSTPFERDIVKEIADAFREQGIKVGWYFSPDDFHVLWKQGTLISRVRPEALPENNPELMQVNKRQVKELLTRYGKIDVLFIDGPKGHNDGGLSEYVWELEPDCLITRGAIVTPEISASTGQSLPEEVLDVPWEANFTMGTSWHFKPTNETYFPGRKWIQNLIETRAKGGTMLLNIGPKPNGEIPQEQENILREIATWMTVNSEAIYDTRPWHVIREGDIWYTRKGKDTVYAFVCLEKPWTHGEQKSFTLKQVRTSKASKITVLGQNDLVLEYKPEIIPTTTFVQTGDSLMITATRAQRIYNDRTWPNPVVFKITKASKP
ncbi:MAG: alpha-L-fucosidase [Puniceicoccaceae bacterium]